MSVATNLTRCDLCGLPFPEPVTNWDDYFADVEDAAFCCARCADLEGLPVEQAQGEKP